MAGTKADGKGWEDQGPGAPEGLCFDRQIRVRTADRLQMRF